MNNSVILFDIKKNCWEEYSRPMPELTIDESLVKVEFAGLCGSDMHRIKAPTSHETQVVMGHEIIGTVEKSDKETLIGKKVVINPIANCGKCSYCNDGLTQFCSNSRNIGKNIDGAFAKYLKVPNKSLYIVPANFQAELGVLVDGVAVIINGIKKLSKKPHSVLVIGDGTVGCLSIAVLKALYPEIKISLRGHHNTDYVNQIYSTSVPQENEKFDLTIETVGRAQSDTLNQCVEYASIGGQILIMGVYPPNFSLDFNARTAFYKELAIYGVNSFCVTKKRDDFREALALIDSHPEFFAPLITHKFLLSDFNLGIAKMLDKSKETVIKVIYTTD